MICSFFLFLLLVAERAPADGVSLTQDSRVFHMGNGRLKVTVEKRSAKILSVETGGRDLLKGGSGYWSMSASSGWRRVEGFGTSVRQEVTLDPGKNGGKRAEVACHFHGTGSEGSFPGTAEVRYSLGKDSTVVHACVILGHGVGDAEFRMGEARFVLKLDKEIFDHLSINIDRNRDMPSGREWDEGEPLNVKEARRLTTGRFAGSVEHKYGYSAILGDVPAYGWCGSKGGFGAWMINPSIEYIAGGPTKMELTGHLDVGEGGRPTLLNMWHGSHYGGTVLNLAKDENWRKVIGPFALYFNQGEDPAGLWRDAERAAADEAGAWPFEWFGHDAYQNETRGTVSGSIRVESGFADDKPRGIRVGLTAPDYQISAWRGRKETIGWQRDGKFYQYWTRASADGVFRLTGVRPGKYVLRAFADGVWGEFSKEDVEVGAGGTLEVGRLRWRPERAGATLWQIGIPDRSAAEFRNGDRYWEWGNYLKYKEDFPNGVDYKVGTSDWRKDWHICQPLELSEDWRVLGPSVWTIRFPLEPAPKTGARLRVGLCGSRAGSRFSVSLNGQPLGQPEDLPENGVMHRDSHRGMWMERSWGISAFQLRAGENVLRFRLEGGAWHQGVLYDCVRLESDDGPGTAAAR